MFCFICSQSSETLVHAHNAGYKQSEAFLLLHGPYQIRLIFDSMSLLDDFIFLERHVFFEPFAHHI